MDSLPVYFISDLHLGAGYIPSPREHEARVVRFLESLHGRASALIMDGDVLDYWFEYRTVVPRGYVRFFGALARLADSGVKITWLTGNHDIWLFDYIRDEIGVTIVDGPVVRDILGKRFYISHGDREGEPTAGFRLIQWLFRNKFTQKLYSGIHPRWTVGFAHRWSASSRDFANYRAPEFNASEEPLIGFCENFQKTHAAEGKQVDYFVFGHRHTLARYRGFTPPAEMIILGDWITRNRYGVFDGTEFSLSIFEENGK